LHFIIKIFSFHLIEKYKNGFKVKGGEFTEFIDRNKIYVDFKKCLLDEKKLKESKNKKKLYKKSTYTNQEKENNRYSPPNEKYESMKSLDNFNNEEEISATFGADKKFNKRKDSNSDFRLVPIQKQSYISNIPVYNHKLKPNQKSSFISLSTPFLAIP